MIQVHNSKCEVGATPIVFETGWLAKQANGSVVVRAGDTVVLVAVCMSPDSKPGQDFFPLTVEYNEKFYASGRIPGGFFKREARPSTNATLCCRLIDRPIRPLFPKTFLNETVVTVTVLSVDGEHAPEVLALNGTSAALGISELPFQELVGAVRVGKVEGKLILNPTREQEKVSSLDLLIAATEDAIIMVEAGAQELPETEMLEALFFGHEGCRKSIAAQKELVAKCGKEKYKTPEGPDHSEFYKMVYDKTQDGIMKSRDVRGKKAHGDHIAQVFTDLKAQMAQEKGEAWVSENYLLLSAGFEKAVKQIIRKSTVETKIRVDGRKLNEIRPITTSVGFLPRTHGSALFTRGETQALCVSTLGGPKEYQIIDDIEGESHKRFFLHYNFPGFSVGEARANRGAGRREIGHGVLAERALQALMPSKEEFPYVVRMVSEILESNGSSSMATICGGSMSMMDAGIPLKGPCAGIAMGLIGVDGQFAILSDIQGEEDHFGDMDFKVAGTKNGITALQLDCKIKGISREIMQNALAQAKEGRMHILQEMAKTIQEGRKEMSPYAPRIETVAVDPDKIRLVIGPGGKNIKKITEQSGAKIDIEDDGRVHITALSAKSMAIARRLVEMTTEDAQVGKIYQGRVTRLMKFGAFVEILPGTEGLCHISQIDVNRINRIEDAVQVGDEIEVKVVEIDPQGRINLSRKQILQAQQGEN